MATTMSATARLTRRKLTGVLFEDQHKETGLSFLVHKIFDIEFHLFGENSMKLYMH